MPWDFLSNVPVGGGKVAVGVSHGGNVGSGTGAEAFELGADMFSVRWRSFGGGGGLGRGGKAGKSLVPV